MLKDVYQVLGIKLRLRKLRLRIRLQRNAGRECASESGVESLQADLQLIRQGISDGPQSWINAVKEFFERQRRKSRWDDARKSGREEWCKGMQGINVEGILS